MGLISFEVTVTYASDRQKIIAVRYLKRTASTATNEGSGSRKLRATLGCVYEDHIRNLQRPAPCARCGEHRRRKDLSANAASLPTRCRATRRPHGERPVRRIQDRN